MSLQLLPLKLWLLQRRSIKVCYGYKVSVFRLTYNFSVI